MEDLKTLKTILDDAWLALDSKFEYTTRKCLINKNNVEHHIVRLMEHLDAMIEDIAKGDTRLT